MAAESRIEGLFARLAAGDSSARDELFECVHAELHDLARAEMARQRPSHTLQPTALVNEAYLKLGGKHEGEWTDRAHFLRLAGKAMRQILVDHARGKNALRRADPGPRVELEDLAQEYDRRSGGVLELEDALDRLHERDPALVQLVELRFYAGRSMEEIALILDISPRSAARRWEVARVLLRSELGG